jgi:hypothetical protein
MNENTHREEELDELRIDQLETELAALRAMPRAGDVAGAIAEREQELERRRRRQVPELDDRAPCSERVFEQMLDRATWRRLNRDGAYRNAENAEEQKAAEERIEAEELARLEARYRVEPGYLEPGLVDIGGYRVR